MLENLMSFLAFIPHLLKEAYEHLLNSAMNIYGHKYHVPSSFCILSNRAHYGGLIIGRKRSKFRDLGLL